jgi:hypothetical protein
MKADDPDRSCQVPGKTEENHKSLSEDSMSHREESIV